MSIREINQTELPKLLPCLEQLAEHHNQVSVNFKGCYPSKPLGETLIWFATDLQNQISHIAVVEEAESIVGFCKVDIVKNYGKLDYLAVRKEHRGKGYGTKLMTWAMELFRENCISNIEVKVVDGNPAIHLYEKFGFRMNAHVLRYCEEKM